MNRLTLNLVALATLAIPSLVAQEASERFYQAIRQNNLTELTSLLKSGSVNQKDARGGTPLLYAAAIGSLDAVHLLCVNGADVNAANDFGATPLMLAIGEPEKAAFLIGRGADINARSKMGRTPLLLAAATDGVSQTVKLLLDRGATLDIRDNRQVTPLLAAAYANDFATLRLLLERGAHVNDKDADGYTPLMYASVNGNLPAVRLLLARGADVNAVTAAQANGTVKNGPIALGNLTPLMLAAAYGGPAMLDALLDAGANMDAQDIRGMTPLMLAVASDHADSRSVRLLVKRGADLTIRDCRGLTARAWAAKYNSAAIMQELGMEFTRVSGKETLSQIAATPLPGAQAAAAKAVNLLQRTSETFFREGGCMGCHAQNLTAMAVQAAVANHVPADLAGQPEELKAARLQLGSLEQPLLQRMDPPTAEILSFALLQMAAGGAPADRGTDAIVYNLAAQQRQAGNWHMGIARPPMGDGDFTRTAVTVRALQVYGPPARKADLQKKIDRAAAWLASGTARTTEDQTMQLLGLHWAGADRQTRQEGIRKLQRQQREDGGWAQNADLASDAYATGQVLYTLHELGVPASDPAYRRGVAYLLRTQQEDGSWHVRSRAARIQPYFESGFPYGHDQWISSAATAWASMALSFAASL
ncbi:MAG: hypothetical protein C5B51_14275 [Terriglobia bacterium]|nr:MAG: hypothetical protein C5B51_14275 [Terriglobia bacterium]